METGLPQGGDGFLYRREACQSLQEQSNYGEAFSILFLPEEEMKKVLQIYLYPTYIFSGFAKGLLSNFQPVTNWTRNGTKPQRQICSWKENLQLDYVDSFDFKTNHECELQ